LQRGNHAGTGVERHLALGRQAAHHDGDAFSSESMRHGSMYRNARTATVIPRVLRVAARLVRHRDRDFAGETTPLDLDLAGASSDARQHQNIAFQPMSSRFHESQEQRDAVTVDRLPFEVMGVPRLEWSSAAIEESWVHLGDHVRLRCHLEDHGLADSDITRVPVDLDLTDDSRWLDGFERVHPRLSGAQTLEDPLAWEL
jgi:hypothetical protein